MHNILLAHGLSVQALRSNRNYQVGIVLNNEYPEPYSQDIKDVQAAKLFDSIYNRWFADGIFKGSYPKQAMELLSSHLPINYESNLKTISQSLDWIGINYYTRSVIKYRNSNDGVNYQCIRGNLKKTDMDWEFFPEGLGYFLRRIKYEYDSKIPIYVTENGMANRDQINIKNEILDEDRIEYFQLHLDELSKCLKEKISLKGYFAWSLLDNYEWSFGYEKRFGLVHINYENFKRTPKSSYYQFKKYLN
jgi:beta-glucosidase